MIACMNELVLEVFVGRARARGNNKTKNSNHLSSRLDFYLRTIRLRSLNEVEHDCERSTGRVLWACAFVCILC